MFMFIHVKKNIVRLFMSACMPGKNRVKKKKFEQGGREH